MTNKDNLSFEELNFARPLDIHTWSDYPEVNIFVDLIFKEMGKVEGNQRIVKKSLKVLLLDLYVAWSTNPNLLLMFSRDNNQYKARSRYNELHISKKIIAIVDALVDAGFINDKIGIHDRETGSSFRTRLWPTRKLIEKFKRAKFSVFHIHHSDQRETVVLRNEDKEDLKYEDADSSFDIHAARTLLKDYNKLLDRTHIDLDTLEASHLELGTGPNRTVLEINQRNKFVRRIFNKSSWDKGGRFYGGWWQQCPKEWRKKIAFDGVRAMELDYSGFHIVLLYALVGIDYWKDINVDPYLIDPTDCINPAIDLRSVAKLLFLTAINASNEDKTYRAFRDQCEPSTKEKNLTNNQLKLIIEQLRTKHSPISDKFASSEGLNLMYIESQVTERLIERFVYHHKCPILCIHDSYLVPFGWDRMLHSEMKDAFSFVTGMTDPCIKHTQDFYDIVQHGYPPGKEPSDLVVPIRSERHLRELALFNEVKDKPSTEDWHPEWTYMY